MEVKYCDALTPPVVFYILTRQIRVPFYFATKQLALLRTLSFQEDALHNTMQQHVITHAAPC